MSKPETSLKIFISYARRDGSSFAEELVDALDVAGFEGFLDRNDIAAGEDWEKRLEALIASADTLVFVMTPGAVASERCGWEIAKADSLGKRIVPVVLIPVGDNEAPPSLGRLNYIFFDGRQSFSRALRQLSTALTVDAAWIREHTRIGELAERWVQRGKPDVLLLRGPELEAARRWVEGATASAPQPTELQRDFIATSERHEHEQASLEAERLAAVGVEQAAKEAALRTLSRRTMIGLVATAALAVGAGGFAYWGVNAEGRFREARRQAEEAESRSLEAAISSEAARKDIAGQLIAHAVAPGDQSTPGERAQFSARALQALFEPSISATDAFTRAQNALDARVGRQRPLLSTSLNGDLYLGRTNPSRTLKAMVVAGGSRFVDDFESVLINAQAWEDKLRAHGFDVDLLANPTAARFNTAFGDFVEGAQDFAGSTVTTGTSSGPRETEATPPLENSLYVFVYIGETAYLPGRQLLGFSDTDAADPDTLLASSGDLALIAAALARRSAASIIVMAASQTLFTGGARLSR